MSDEIDNHIPAITFDIWQARNKTINDIDNDNSDEEEKEEAGEEEQGSAPYLRSPGTIHYNRRASDASDCAGGGGRTRIDSVGGGVAATETADSTCLCTWACGRRCVVRCGSACFGGGSTDSGRSSSSSLGEPETPPCGEPGGRRACREDCWLGRFYCMFLFTMALLSVIVIVVCVSTWQARGFDFDSWICPGELYQCRSGHCLNNSKMCDGIPDCPDMSDEADCDPYQKVYWNFNYVKRPEADRDRDESQDCKLGHVPDHCQCRNRTHLFCEDAGLTRVPPDIPRDVTLLDLSGNTLSVLHTEDLANLSRLRELYIMHTSLTAVSSGAFVSLTDLTIVYLTDNTITDFPWDSFSVKNDVKQLKLSGNHIRTLEKDDLRRLGSLEYLSLDRNHIVSIHPEAFRWTPNLKQLFLNNNRLSTMDFRFPCLQLLDLSMNNLRVLPTDYFAGSSGLRNLYLKDNGIDVIQPGAFNGMKGLFTLSLSGNKLVSLKSGTFEGLENLEVLMLSNNKIIEVDIDAFNPMTRIQSIELTGNPLRRLENGTFTNLRNLSYLYFDKFYLCAYARHVEVCLPWSDGISSFDNLLENGFLRVSVWIVALLACGGNLLVLLGRCLMREDNQSHSFFIKNLSLADMLTGIYLLVIGSKDLMYRGDYLFYDDEWRNSWECDLCGVLAAISSEVSVLTLTVITLDRYICISYPLALRRRGLKVAYSVMGVTWTLCILLASLPLMGLDYFGNSFYRDNAVCIPLHLHEPRAQGWEYSTFLFLGINLASFAFITYAYTAMFIAINQSDVQLRTSRERRERCLVKRFFFIVITDFACWVPIIVIKAIALGGAELSNDLYAWVVVFILPVNSALNPLLYTLTTRLFREKLLSKLTTAVWRPSNKDLTLNSSTSTKARNSLSRNAGLEVELKPLRPSRKAGSPMLCGTIR